MNVVSINPASGVKINEFQRHSPEQVSNMIINVHEAWLHWRTSSLDTRSQLLIQMADVLNKRKLELAELMAREMGKPVTQGLSEIEKCADCCHYYATQGPKHLMDRSIPTEGSKSYVTFQPLGVILAVMPWNFPFWQVFRFLVPALAAGNCGVLKHASNVSGCALAIEEIVKQAGFPDNLFKTLLIGSNQVGEVIENPLIKAVTLTGSNKAGIEVAKKAGSVLKKVVLELGGSDAYVILEDADIEQAVETCVNSRLINSGQSCIAAKRFVVTEAVSQKFTELFVARMRQLVMGNPLEQSTDVGPQARQDLRDELHQQVVRSVEKGAVCLLGGEVTPGNHAFYPPTVLVNVKPGMPAYDEELFGPVAAIIEARDEADAIRIANDSEFGLGSAIFTSDLTKGEAIARNDLEAGSAYVNERVRSDPRLAFGGIKNSGYGRELGEFGIHEFVNIKTIYIK